MSPNTIHAGVPEPRKPQPAGVAHSAPQTVARVSGATAPVKALAEPVEPVVTVTEIPNPAPEPVVEEAAAPVEVAAVPRASGELMLPASILTRTDVSRSVRELDSLNDYFRQAAIRGSKEKGMPALSRVLDTFATENGLNFLHAPDRDKAKEFLDKVKAKGPVVHVSFAADPSGDFLARLMGWFRSEAHPFVMLHVGLQPELAAGCKIRTTNKFFDFSFRARFDASKHKLTEAIEALGAKVDPLEEKAAAQAPMTADQIAVEAGQIPPATPEAPATPVAVEAPAEAAPPVIESAPTAEQAAA